MSNENRVLLILLLSGKSGLGSRTICYLSEPTMNMSFLSVGLVVFVICPSGKL